MKLEIIEKKDNKLLKRTEVRFKIDHEGGPTPPRKDVLQLLKTQLGSEFIVIQKIRSIFGKSESVGRANVYSSKEQMLKLEPKHLIKRDEKALAKKEEKAETPAPEPKTEEEAKEEVKNGEEEKSEDKGEETPQTN